MSETSSPEGKKVKIFLANNFVFRGTCIGIREGFFILMDEKTGHVMLFGQASINSIEVLADG